MHVPFWTYNTLTMYCLALLDHVRRYFIQDIEGDWRYYLMPCVELGVFVMITVPIEPPTGTASFNMFIAVSLSMSLFLSTT